MTTDTTEPELIGADEASRALGIDRSTLTRWVAKGRLKPAHKVPGLRGPYLFDRTYIANFDASEHDTSP